MTGVVTQTQAAAALRGSAGPVLRTWRGPVAGPRPSPDTSAQACLGTMSYAPPLRALAVGASGMGATCDAWLAEGHGALRRGRHGPFAWVGNGAFSYGELRWPEPADGAEGAEEAAPARNASRADALEQAARDAYLTLFEALAEAGTPHPLRLWNYLPRINACDGGVERYRRFNAGRQQAFIDAGRPAFEGAPAACALGSTDGSAEGGLVLRFLAARRPPRALENPRQVSAYRYPPQYGARAPTFSRAALADVGGGEVALFVSGTASIVGHESRHAGDVHAQLEETLLNLHAVLREANAQLARGAFALEQLAPVVYVRHPAEAAAVHERLAPIWSGPACAQAPVFVQADICRSELRVEIEGHAFVAGSLR